MARKLLRSCQLTGLAPRRSSDNTEGVPMLNMQEFARMTEPERREALATVTSAAPNGALTSLHQSIARFEAQYEMTSAEMRERFASGALEDTAETSEWLMLLRVRERVSR